MQKTCRIASLTQHGITLGYHKFYIRPYIKTSVSMRNIAAYEDTIENLHCRGVRYRNSTADTINSLRQSRSIFDAFSHVKLAAQSKLHSCASHPAKPCRVKPDSQRRKVKVTSTQSNCYFRISNICTPTKF